MTTRLLYITTVPLTLRSFLLPYAAHFRSRGYRVDAAASGISSCSQCRAAFDQVHDITFARNLLNPFKLAQACRQVRKLVAEQQYDLVHVHTPIASFITRFALRKLRHMGRPKVIYTAHGFHFHPNGRLLTNFAFKQLEKIAGKWADFLIAINQDDFKAARQERILSDDRIILMPGIGVDLDKYSPEKVPQIEVDRVRSELQLDEGNVLFLMIGEFNPGKRHRDALAAFKLMPEKAHLVLAGEGPLKEPLQAWVKKNGMEKRVHFLGQRTDVPALIRSARATLLPSEREGLPRSIMESLCLEVPVIGTHIRGIRDLVDHSCGMLVPIGDTHSLFEAMRHLFEHSDQAQLLGKNGRAKMADCDIRKILTSHESLYELASKET